MCLTFVRPVHGHLINLVELATEGCFKVWVWREHTLRLAVDKLVSQCPQERLLLLRLLGLTHDFAQYALLVSARLYCWRIAAYARAVIDIADIARVHISAHKVALFRYGRCWGAIFWFGSESLRIRDGKLRGSFGKELRSRRRG